MTRKARTYTISAVADQYGIHPQTLRLYEREGLLKPSRSEGNTRLYTDPDLERLELILSLTRDLGVNLAGVEIILNMREKMDAMQREFERFFEYLQSHAEEFSHFTEPPPEAGALVPISVTGGQLVGGPGSGYVRNGDTVSVTHQSASTPGTAVTTTVRVGGLPGSSEVPWDIHGSRVVATFTSTTR